MPKINSYLANIFFAKKCWLLIMSAAYNQMYFRPILSRKQTLFFQKKDNYKKYAFLPNLKFSDLLPETHILFVWRKDKQCA